MISVIIPALNEAETVGSVVQFARRAAGVGEVLVVDNGSIDGTPELAAQAGAVVITGSLQGKGASMEDGMKAARHEVLLYLDADLAGLRPDLIARLTRPILDGRADFVKASFARSAGRVTALTARPLLRVFFPELVSFQQPLGGIIAARRSLLQGMGFENDYGVDIGLLLDAALAGARLAEVDVGSIEHVSHPLEALGDMAAQVVRTILDRAARSRRMRRSQLQDAEDSTLRGQAELSVILRRIGKGERLALFDMDGVLLDGRFIVHLARRTDRLADLEKLLDNPHVPAPQRTQRIAALFAGVPRLHFEQTAREIPLMEGARETVVALRRTGHRVGIVTDSFHVAAEIVRRRVFADFCVSHLASFRRGRATGRVTLSPLMAHPQGCPLHLHCKVNVVLHLRDAAGFRAARLLAVGDGENDICMLRAAATSVAFRPRTAEVSASARHTVKGNLTDILALLHGETTGIAA
ncbi:MAG: glycosyltransferase [Gemmataceae bacterium]